MIKINNLSKSYGDVKAVKSIDFELNDGEVVGFLGANGAGKSTTLKIITGYLTPTSGSVLIKGKDILAHTHEIQKEIGYLPELNPLYTEMRVYDLLHFTALIRNISGTNFKKALSRVVVDCSGRPGLEYNANYPRARIGEFDVDLIFEFFQGFVNHAMMTLHIDNIRGRNSHHIAETIFKAFGRSLRVAVEIDPVMKDVLPSTKGSL